jgi:glycosyltransferase involved in cell wall biosynthesis
LVKGVIPLLQAIAKVRAALPDALCVMPGSVGRDAQNRSWWKGLLSGAGPERRASELIAEFSLEKNVLRLPFTFRMEYLLAAADVVVVPFVVPHFARPVIEAGAMAKPVVASRIGGVAEVVQDGVTGLLVEPNNPGQLADALVRVLQDRELASRLGEGGYAQAREKFDAKRNAAATVAVYDALLPRRQPAAVLTPTTT